MENPTPIHILSGFLGSGKTTLLAGAIDYYTGLGRKPAVIMNEIGEVNLDGLLIDSTIPMTEMLSGCICCTIQGDLGLTIRNLMLEYKPDVIFIEATGAANPMEILDGVADASLLLETVIKSVITVVDAPHFLQLKQEGKGKTFRLMVDQIRCATLLILNKIDLVRTPDLAELEGALYEINKFAPIYGTVFCQIDMNLLDSCEQDSGNEHAKCINDHGIHEHNGDDGHSCDHDHPEKYYVHRIIKKHHHSHDHVMVYTHYFRHAIDKAKFEEIINELPQEVYRAKGIMVFSDAPDRVMFQYAYRHSNFLNIAPKVEVPNVAVFIGENFSKEKLQTALGEL
ncbi:MAG TPA: GTP-binding protein [Bacilli bacterium]